MLLALDNMRTRARIYEFGGMVLPEFTLEGRPVHPLFLPAWADGDVKDPFMKALRGDFVCVPFGGGSDRTLPPDWQPLPDREGSDGFPHGYGAHHAWHVETVDKTRAVIAINYPETHPIEGLKRLVQVDVDQVLFEDYILARRDCRLPIGLHPIFRLPEPSGSARLRLPECRRIHTFPGDVDESSCFVANTSFDTASTIVLRGGGQIDATVLPLPVATEELLLLCGLSEGRVELDNPAEGYRVILSWDVETLPNCLLWFSNRGRRFEPWNGQNLCLGIEPVASAFDLGCAVSLGITPLETRTYADLRSGKPLCLRHAIRVEKLQTSPINCP